MASEGDEEASTGLLTRCEQQWQRTAEHARTYPYVWASYAVTFGGLGIYGAWRWRELRRVENHVMQLQRELLNRVQQEEAAASQSLRQPRATEAPVVAASPTKQEPLKS